MTAPKAKRVTAAAKRKDYEALVLEIAKQVYLSEISADRSPDSEISVNVAEYAIECGKEFAEAWSRRDK